MAFAINKAIMMGRLTKAPEVKMTKGKGVDGEQAYVNLVLKSTEMRRDGAGLADEYFKVVAFGKTAESIGQYLKEGSPVYIEGRLHVNKWEDQEGQRRSSIDINATEVQFLPKDFAPNAPVGMNRVIVAGNIGSEPEFRMTGGGTPVGSVSLGVNGRRDDTTEWFPVVGYDQCGEELGQAAKGQMIQIEGRLHTRSWENENGKQYKTEIVADRVRAFQSPDVAPDQGPSR